MRRNHLLGAFVLGVAFVLGGCGGGESADAAVVDGASASASVDAPVAEAPPTGNVVEVKMVTDERGNYFEPSELTVQRGDVVRFVLVSGVHNVSFPADQNASADGLPEASAYLQLPGQTFDLTVGLAPGSYAFQCDPHAALGMTGTLTVQ